MEYISNTLGNLIQQTAFMNLTVGNLIMIAVAQFTQHPDRQRHQLPGFIRGFSDGGKRSVLTYCLAIPQFLHSA